MPTTSVSAVTAQNTCGVDDILPLPEEFIKEQLESVLRDADVKAIKTGMLYSAEIVGTVADILEDHEAPLVVDPVMAASTGRSLSDDGLVEAMRRKLLPICELVTPNRAEAEALAKMQIKTKDDERLAAELIGKGGSAVLMKGGHCEGSPVFVTDWLLEKGCEPVALRQPHVDTPNTHGTGCTLSAGIAAQIALGMPLRVAVTKAQEFLNLALRRSFAPGKGRGLCNHMAGLR